MKGLDSWIIFLCLAGTSMAGFAFGTIWAYGDTKQACDAQGYFTDGRNHVYVCKRLDKNLNVPVNPPN